MSMRTNLLLTYHDQMIKLSSEFIFSCCLKAFRALLLQDYTIDASSQVNALAEIPQIFLVNVTINIRDCTSLKKQVRVLSMTEDCKTDLSCKVLLPVIPEMEVCLDWCQLEYPESLVPGSLTLSEVKYWNFFGQQSIDPAMEWLIRHVKQTLVLCSINKISDHQSNVSNYQCSVLFLAMDDSDRDQQVFIHNMPNLTTLYGSTTNITMDPIVARSLKDLRLTHCDLDIWNSSHVGQLLHNLEFLELDGVAEWNDRPLRTIRLHNLPKLRILRVILDEQEDSVICEVYDNPELISLTTSNRTWIHVQANPKLKIILVEYTTMSAHRIQLDQLAQAIHVKQTLSDSWSPMRVHQGWNQWEK